MTRELCVDAACDTLTGQALLRILGDEPGMRAYEAFASAGLAAFEDLGTLLSRQPS